MVVGMTTVFAFLSVLVVAMEATRVVASWFPQSSVATEPEARGAQQRDDDREIAIVLAAVAAARGE